jgi:hypothetical protein
VARFGVQKPGEVLAFVLVKEARHVGAEEIDAGDPVGSPVRSVNHEVMYDSS